MDFSAQQAKYGGLTIGKDTTQDRINQAVATQPQTKKRSGLAKWLPTAAGVAGTLLAAPFTGGTSLLGTAAILGGGAALGGGLGELGAQGVSGESLNLGKAGKEALISGATGAIPIGGAAKAAKVANQAAKTGAEQGVEQTAQKSLLSKFRTNVAEHGQQAEARSGGFNIGAKVSGSPELRPSQSVNIGKILKDEKIPTGAPATRSFAVDKKLTNYGKQIDTALTKSNRSLGQGEAQAIADNYLRQVEKLPGVDDNIRKEAQNYATNFVNQAKDVKGTVGFRRGLDKDEISWIKNPDAATSAKQLAASTFRDTLHSTINTLAPELKGLNNSYHKLSKAQGYLVKETGRGGKGGIVNRIAESGPIQSVESKVGSLLQKITPKETTDRSLLSKIAGEGVKQTVGQTVGGESPLAPTPPDLAAEYAADPTNPKFNGVDPAQFGYPADNTLGATDQPPSESSGLDQSHIDEAIKQALANGDTKGLSNLLAVADYYDKKATSVSKGGNLNSTASGVIADTKTGLASLQNLGQLITSSTANNPIVGRVRGANPYDTNAQNLQAAIATTKQIVGKALEGGVLRKEDELKYAKLLPTMGDTDSTAQNKITQLVNLISGRLGEYQANIKGGTGGTDLAALGL